MVFWHHEREKPGLAKPRREIRNWADFREMKKCLPVRCHEASTSFASESTTWSSQLEKKLTRSHARRAKYTTSAQGVHILHKINAAKNYATNIDSALGDAQNEVTSEAKRRQLRVRDGLYRNVNTLQG